MTRTGKNKGIWTVGLFAGFTGLIVLAFSLPVTSAVLKKWGLRFPGSSEVVASFQPASGLPEKKVVSHQITHHSVPDTLSKSEKHAIDTLRAKVKYLENFDVSASSTALTAFFQALSHRNDTAVHVWYYGDSQIEGDRISQDLRLLMQADLGGSGMGYVPFSDVASYRTIELGSSPDWQSLNCFVNKSPKGFGFAGKVFRLSPNDSQHMGSVQINIQKSQRYNSLWLLYGNGKGGVLTLNGKDSGGRKINFRAEKVSGKILLSSKPLYGKIKLQLPAGNNYFGYLLEGNNGVQVDNCGIRGHSGDGLAYISDAMLMRQAAQLNTRLVIFHFGNNMIPYIRSKNMDYFRKEFERLFSRYRRLLPNASVLVISPGDMGYETDGSAASYPYIADLAEAMRTAAKNTGCAYFDMHALMQKDGGILTWTRKGLANLDGHLSPAGQMKFANALYGELRKELQVHQIINSASKP